MQFTRSSIVFLRVHGITACGETRLSGSSEIARNRPTGVKPIAAYLCLKAAALILAVVASHTEFELRSEAADFLLNVVPLIPKFGLQNYVSILAPVFALVDLVLGLGIWHLKRWARTFIVVNLTWGLARAGMFFVATAAFDRKMFPLIASSPYLPYFLFDLVSSVPIFFCLLDPDVMQAFRVPE